MKKFTEYIAEVLNIPPKGGVEPYRKKKTNYPTVSGRKPRVSSNKGDSPHTMRDHPTGTPKGVGEPVKQDRSLPKTTAVSSVRHAKTGKPVGQFKNAGDLVNTHFSPSQSCPHCAAKTIVKLHHDKVPGFEGKNRWCYDCGHKWNHGGLKEETISEDLHPLHAMVTGYGYKHTGTDNAPGRKTLTYDHPNGTSIDLHHNKYGDISWSHRDNKGTASTSNDSSKLVKKVNAVKKNSDSTKNTVDKLFNNHPVVKGLTSFANYLHKKSSTNTAVGDALKAKL